MRKETACGYQPPPRRSTQTLHPDAPHRRSTQTLHPAATQTLHTDAPPRPPPRRSTQTLHPDATTQTSARQHIDYTSVVQKDEEYQTEEAVFNGP
ncbi:hypothetical protein NHX12_008779 [Muraenolepis orangiensis]|uniref:Uncharacterized protein n=1 Tax=Muraenolepis orangiensis TaxID=630683 RepID=A0A9Q0IBK2_9TELE|nr:hypothetical protein NHX12_008779 [Muraenolepis orangiensis]